MAEAPPPVAAVPEERDIEPSRGAAANLFDYQFSQVNRVSVGEGRTVVSAETNAASPRAGSFGVRFFIDNSAGPAGVVQLALSAFNVGTNQEVRRAVELKAGERRTVTVPVPSEFRYCTVRASGPGITVQPSASLYFQSTYDPQRVALTLSQPEDFEAYVGHKPAYSGASTLVNAVPPAEAPTELAAYLGYDLVVVPSGEALEALDEAQRRALEHYAATGGHVVLGSPPRSQAMFPLLSQPEPGEHPYGFGKLIVRAGGALDPERVFRPALPVSPEGPVPDYERRYGEVKPDVLLPFATAPLGRFLLIIGLFTLAIGPGSVWVARRRGPAALLVTIPGTALVTCLAIITYSVIADGFTVHASVYGYTLLDAKQHRAVTHGLTAYYANLGPSRVTFAPGTMVVGPHAERRERYMASLTWGDGLKLGGDFLPSRTYREWGFVSVAPTRARLVVKRRGDGLVLQNALGVPLLKALVNVEGVTYSVESVRDGSEGTLRTGEVVALTPVRAHERFSNDVKAAVTSADLKPGEFLALVGGEGFVPNGGIHLQLHQAEHWVRGEVER
jgi:hypothetical protein